MITLACAQTTILTVFATLVATATIANAAEIKMLASFAVKEAYSELLPQFEETRGGKVTIEWAGTFDIARRIRDGEMTDIVVSTAASIDELMKEGKLSPGSRIDVAKSPIGVAARTGIAKPNITSNAALRRSLLAAKSVVLSGGPSGVYLLGLFEKMGIAGQMKEKTKRLASGESVGEALARGEGDIGFTQVSELLAIEGINYLGPLSSDVQQITTFSAATLPNAPQLLAALTLLQFLTGPEAAPALKKSGLEPG